MITKTWKLAAKAGSKKSKNWLTAILAGNRGLTNSRKLHDFLNPNLEQIIKVELTEVEKGVKRVSQALKNNEKIIVYSDYDADGLCATAIVWETLNDLRARVMPYVPHRVKEGYGLSTDAIEEMAKKGVKLIITVDHGITAIKQVEAAKKLGIDVVITDHHLKPKTLPKSYATVHTTDLCGAGVAWRFCWELVKKVRPQYKNKLLEKLELAAIATIADLVPLVGANRAIVKIGLRQINKTKRPGLKSLIKSARIKDKIGSYEIGHIIAPRINAMGRLEHGIESLRLLCAKNPKVASDLANLLFLTNTKRQNMTVEAVVQALEMYDKNQLIGVLGHEAWHEGIIGLIASRLAEKHHRPIIAISRGKKVSKGSARSIPGFNIVEAIRSSSEYLVDAGGHPMAAGFTIHTKHIESFSKKINVYAQKNISPSLLTPFIQLECELGTSEINLDTLNLVKNFEPFGVGNPQPIFLTKNMLIEDVRGVGQNHHLKLFLNGVSAIGFGMGEERLRLRPGNNVDAAYTIEEDKFNGANKVQMKIKDLRFTSFL